MLNPTQTPHRCPATVFQRLRIACVMLRSSLAKQEVVPDLSTTEHVWDQRGDQLKLNANLQDLEAQLQQDGGLGAGEDTTTV